MRVNKRMLIVVLAGLLAIGALGAGVVAAQEGGGERPGATSEMRHQRPALKGLKALFEASGLDREVFATGFADGLTVGEVLEASGLDPHAVVADALALIGERGDQAVADGVIDEARAAEIMANAEEGLQALLDVTPEKPHRPGPGVIRHHFLGIVAETIGITPAELREDLSDGDTIAEVAESYGVDPQAVIDAVLAPLFERIDQAEANSRLTPEEAAEKKAAATERVTNIVFNGPGSGETP